MCYSLTGGKITQWQMLHKEVKSRTKSLCVKSIELIKAFDQWMELDKKIWVCVERETSTTRAGGESRWLSLWGEEIATTKKKNRVKRRRNLAKIKCWGPLRKLKTHSRALAFVVWRICTVKRRKCDRRCNAKQCTVLWMGRQVLYEWRGSCDRSTSQSRYFSLTVNTHTRDRRNKTIGFFVFFYEAKTGATFT